MNIRHVTSKFFSFTKIFLLSFLTAFIALSVFTYHADDSSFNLATDQSVKNFGGIIGSHIADILIQVFGVSSFIIIPLMVFFIINVLYRINKNIYLYVISSLVIISGISGLISSMSLKITHKYYHGGLLGNCFQNYSSAIFLLIILVGIIGVLGWKNIVYLYWASLKVYRKVISYFHNQDDIIVKAGPNKKTEQAQGFCIIEDEDLINKEVLDKSGKLATEDLDCADIEEELEFQDEYSDADSEPDDEYYADSESDDEYYADSQSDDEYSDADSEPDDEYYAGSRSDDAYYADSRSDDEYNEVEKTIDNSPLIFKAQKKGKVYTFPSVDYLSKSNPVYAKKFHPDNNVANLLDKVLKDFSIHGKIVNIKYGPVVTLYEFEPSAGTKSSRVIGLSDDIARSMSALSTRISVIPGRNVIGIELPNHYREIVMLRDLFESEQYKDSSLTLPIALGKGIDGEVVIADLVKMPHLLIAGTTGSGKSVAINTMILSLVYSLTPDQCKMIMIDPKVLELSVYNSIPHLLTPVVTESKKAIAALKWVVSEMENRYRLMSDIGVRNIVGYNNKIKEAIAEGRAIEKILQTGFDKDTGEAIFEKVSVELKIFPYIIVIVDEMADLMLVAGKEIESSIQRLSQMARAAGIHIIMATQRPSVDVITGVIKANFPTRISFAVTSKIDSRTILGEQGAEQLLGMGDMLYMVSGGRIVRIHGAFVSDNEVQNVVEYLKSQGTPEYIDGITQVQQQDYDYFMDDNLPERDDDELYQQAVSIVIRDKRTSISYIQRQLRIGYNRAANLVERMERDGIIGISNTGKRELLLKK